MAHFIFIHGAWHGGWCWEKLLPLITSAGHSVDAPDLPGMGGDTTEFAPDVLAQWADFIAGRVREAAGRGERVILVGHSRGGAVASLVAERVPEHIARLVYLAAYLLVDGQSINDVVKADLSAGPGEVMDVNRDTGLCTVKPGMAADAFYTLAAPVDAAAAEARLCPEPTRSFLTPVSLSAARYGTVPRAYIAASRDKAISHAAQLAMVAATPCDPLLTLASDHCPFLSAPEELAEALLGLV